ncbi:MFS transporter [Neptunicella sp.]|uniref:MFS transporter n=1 Tax=Neptunicella sp. TaxID=2125986 RepID=UPI003F68D029
MTQTQAQSMPTAYLAKYKVAPHGVFARIILAFLTTAGIFYINIIPALVSGLIEGLQFNNQQAGFVSSANLYGAAAGALSAVFLIKRINWVKWSYCLLVGLISIDLLCIYIRSAELMIVIRGLHGLVGGLLVGIGFSIISRTNEADKTFGYLLFIQWGLGGLGIMYLPGLVPEFGTGALFLSLAIFSVATLLMLPFLPAYPVPEQPTVVVEQTNASRMPLFFTLAGIFLFQAANMGLFAYMIGLGRASGLTLEFMSPALASASWIALLGAFLVIVVGTRFGRTMPLLVSVLLTAACSWALLYSQSSQIYLIANIIIGITWAFALPYMFGICSELDKAGQLAALGGFASKMGLASGPMVAALLVGEDQYDVVINVSVIVLILCAIVVLKPARLLDNIKSKLA